MIGSKYEYELLMQKDWKSKMITPEEELKIETDKQKELEKDLIKKFYCGELTIQEMAIMLSDNLLFDEWVQDIEYIFSSIPNKEDMLNHVDKRNHLEDLKIANEKFSKLYHYLHSVIESHLCYNYHSDWRDEIRRDFENIIIKELEK